MAIEFRRLQKSDAALAESRPILRGIGMILLITSLALIVAAVSQAVTKYRTVESWTPVQALVLQFRLINEPHGRVLSNYRAHYMLQYEVNGRTLVTPAQSDYSTGSGSQLSSWSRYFRPGQRREIRYNPAEPAEITTDNFDLESFRYQLWLGCWALGIFVVGVIFRSL